MTRTMYDSITATDIPLTAPIVAGYINGTYKWSTADWARFPHAVHVPIATQANINDGTVLDVEPGDATPTQAVDWVLKRRAAGIDPTVYCNQLNGWQSCKDAFTQRGVTHPHWWVARYDNNPTIPPGAVAKQYANPATHKQGHYDLSVVADYWPGIDKEPTMDLTQANLDAIAYAVNMWRSPDPHSTDIEAAKDVVWETNRLAAAILNLLQNQGTVTLEPSGSITFTRVTTP